MIIPVGKRRQYLVQVDKACSHFHSEILHTPRSRLLESPILAHLFFSLHQAALFLVFFSFLSYAKPNSWKFKVTINTDDE